MFIQKKARPLAIACLLTGLVAWAGPAAAQVDAPEGYAAQTTQNLDIPTDQLRLMLTPLNRGELKIEANAWLELIREKTREIANAEIQAKRAAAEAAQAKDLAAEAASAKKDAEKAKEKAAEAGGDVQDADAGAAAEKIQKAADAAKKDPKAAGETAEAVKAAAADAAAGGDASEVAEAVKKVAEEKAEQHQQQKTAQISQAQELRDQRARLIDRLNVVLKAYVKKGGDRADYDQFINAITGLEIDATDASAAYTKLRAWVLSEEGGQRWGLNIVQFVGTLIVFWIIAKIVSSAVRRGLSMTKRASDLLKNFLIGFASRMVWLIGLVVAFSMLEVDVTPLLTAIGAAGFILAFALQGTLSNFAAGIMILMYRPFDVGDAVSVAGVSGVVKSVSLVSTIINTFDNQVVIVPNNSIWGDVITNITGSPTRRIDMVFGISYSDDIDKAINLLRELTENHPLVLKEPAVNIQVHELADSSVNLICRPWSRTADYWTIYWDLHKQVKQRFDAESICIPFPQRDVHLFTQGNPSLPPAEA